MLNSLFNLFSYRKKQMELQEKHDLVLNSLYNKCPLTVFKLLMFEREINRKQLSNTSDSNIFDFYKISKENLVFIDNYQQDLNIVLYKSNFTSCQLLEELIVKYSKI